MAARGLQPLLRSEPGAIHDAFPHQLVPDQGVGARITQVPQVGFRTVSVDRLNY